MTKSFLPSLMAEVDIPLSVNAVLSNYDLLFEILLRLPVLSLVLFKSVSKHWLSLITSPRFITSRAKIPSIDPPSALLIPRVTCEIETLYDSESFDIRIPSKNSTVFTFCSEASLLTDEVLQSCNGLLLCSIHSGNLCVYNPTIKLLKMVPHNCGGGTNLRMAFDPTKSPHYKLIQVVHTPASSMQLHTYSSETSVWSVYGDPFQVISFDGFDEGIYWNDAIHWLNFPSTRATKLYIGNEQPVLTELQLPVVTCDGKSLLQFKLFESRGCLLLLGKDYYVQPQQLMNVYEMRKDDSEWSVKYIVNLDDIMMPFPDVWKIHWCAWCFILGEREEDSFMIIDLLTKVVQYNPVSKTVRTLCDLKPVCSPPDMLVKFGGFQFIPSFAGV